jgi:hypothetical protein
VAGASEADPLRHLGVTAPTAARATTGAVTAAAEGASLDRQVNTCLTC